MARNDLTAERVRELLHYDAETGVFTNRVRRSGSRLGARAEIARGSSYGSMQIDGNVYPAHRIAWLYVHGAWPLGEIDHINREPSDNRIANLRDVPRAINLQNSVTPQRNNGTGYRGVRKAQNKWRATISVQGRSIHLGCFDCPEAAHRAYIDAKSKFHPGAIAQEHSR